MEAMAGLISTIVLGALGFLLYRYYRTSSTYTESARRVFFERREWLEADFMKLGAQSGIPRGLEWVAGDFGNEVEFARDKKSKQLFAFVGVAIKFEAVLGEGMEDVDAVANAKAATAVFVYDGKKKWSANGKTVFNHNPTETIHFYRNELEKIL